MSFGGVGPLSMALDSYLKRIHDEEVARIQAGPETATGRGSVAETRSRSFVSLRRRDSIQRQAYLRAEIEQEVILDAIATGALETDEQILTSNPVVAHLAAMEDTRASSATLDSEIDAAYRRLKRRLGGVVKEKWEAEANRRDTVVSLRELYLENRHFLVMGRPGSGKSSLLQWLLLRMVEAAMAGKSQLQIRLDAVDPTATTDEVVTMGRVLVPVLVRCPNLAEFLRTHPTARERSVYGYVLQRVALPTEKAALQHVLDSGSALLLLDGLDEVRLYQDRLSILDHVGQLASDAPILGQESFLRDSGTQSVDPAAGSRGLVDVGNRLLLTSRLEGNDLAKLEVRVQCAVVEPMSTEVSREFLEMLVPGQGRKIATATAAITGLSGLLGTPLGGLLVALAWEPQAGGFAASNTLTRILERSLRRMLGAVTPDTEDALTRLGNLAEAMPQHAEALGDERVLSAIGGDALALLTACAKAGLLHKGNFRWGFVHRNVQEFLAARHRVATSSTAEALSERLLSGEYDPHAREVQRLTLEWLSSRRPEWFPQVAAALLDADQLGPPLYSRLLVRALPGLAPELPARTAIQARLVDFLLHRYVAIGQHLSSHRVYVRKLLASVVAVAGFGQLHTSLRRMLSIPTAAPLVAPLIDDLDREANLGLLLSLQDDLEKALPTDDCKAGFPIQRLLHRHAASLSREGRDQGPRQQFSAAVAGADRPAELRTLLATHRGGVDELDVVAPMREYEEMATFLSLKDSERDVWLPHFSMRWGQDDTIYNIAVHLDSNFGNSRKRSQAAPSLGGEYLFAPSCPPDGKWRGRLGDLARGDIDAVVAATRPDEVEAFSRELLRLRASLEDAVARAGGEAAKSLVDAGTHLEETAWGHLVRATQRVLMRCQGACSFGAVLRGAEPERRSTVLAAEFLADQVRGSGDAEMGESERELLGLHDRLAEVVRAVGHAGSRTRAISRWGWSVAALPPRFHAPGDVPIDVLRNIETLPDPEDQVRPWLLSALLSQSSALADLGPEVAQYVRLARWNRFEDGGFEQLRTSLESAVIPDQAKPASPYHAARLLVWQSRIERSLARVHLCEAARLAREVAHPVLAQQVFEWIAVEALRLGSLDQFFVEEAAEAATRIQDPVDRALALGRVSLLQRAQAGSGSTGTAEREMIEAAEQIADQAKRTEVLAALRRVCSGPPQRALFDRAVNRLADPLHRVIALGRHGQVMQKLEGSLGRGREQLHAWSPVILLGLIDDTLAALGRGRDLESLWWTLAHGEPARRAEAFEALIECSNSQRLQITIGAASALEAIRERELDRFAGLLKVVAEPELETVPLLWKWFRSAPRGRVERQAAAILLGELCGFIAPLVEDVIDGMQSQEDALRFRASRIVTCGAAVPRGRVPFAASGEEAALAVMQRVEGEASPQLNAHLIWFFDSLVVDGVGQFDRWVDGAKAQPLSAAGMGYLRFGTDEVFFAAVRRLVEDPTRHVLRCVLRLAHGDRARWLALREVESAVRRALPLPDHWTRFGREDLLQHLRSRVHDDELDPLRTLVEATAGDALLDARGAVDWAVLEKAVRSCYVDSEYDDPVPWEVWDTDDAARQLLLMCRAWGTQHSGSTRRFGRAHHRVFADLLKVASVCSVPDSKGREGQVVGAARWLDDSTLVALRRTLAETQRTLQDFTGRVAAMRILGGIGTVCESTEAALASGMRDVPFVRDAAFEAADRMRQVDGAATVARILEGMRQDPSMLGRLIRARMLASVGRQQAGHTAGDVEQLRTILHSLSAAAQGEDARCNVRFEHVDAKIPSMPHLGEMIYDSLLRMLGVDGRQLH